MFQQYLLSFYAGAIWKETESKSGKEKGEGRNIDLMEGNKKRKSIYLKIQGIVSFGISLKKQKKDDWVICRLGTRKHTSRFHVKN